MVYFKKMSTFWREIFLIKIPLSFFEHNLCSEIESDNPKNPFKMFRNRLSIKTCFLKLEM